MNHIKNFSLTGIAVIFLSIFIIFNSNTNLDLAAFLLIAFILLQKIFGEYFILILLVLRPVLDHWRDYIIFSSRFINININAALSTFLLVWSIIFFIKNYQYVAKIPLKIPWLLLIAWCGLSVFYSYHPPSTVTEVIKLTNLFGLFGISYILTIKDGVFFKHNLLKSMVAAAIVPIAAAIYQLVTRTGITIDEVSNRIYGTFAHPNVLATFALLCFIVLVNHIVTHSKNELKSQNNLLKIYGFTLLGIIAFTYTRIAWIGVAFLFAVIGFVYYKKIFFYIVGTIIIFYALFYPLNQYLVSNYNLNLQTNNLIARLTARNQDYDSITWRTEVINKAIPLFRKQYLTGYGYGTFPRVWDDNKDIQHIWDNTSEAHNDYIKIALESGIIGLILAFVIFASLIYKQIQFAIKNNFKNIVFVSSIFIYLILSISDNMLHHTPVIWWFWTVWGNWEALNTKNQILN